MIDRHLNFKRLFAIVLVTSFLLTSITPIAQLASAKWEASIIFNKRIDRNLLYGNNYGTILIDKDDNLYVAWSEGDYVVTTLLFAKSNDGGQTFTTPVMVADLRANNTTSIQLKGPSMVVKGEEIHMAWSKSECNINCSRPIYLASSFDGGETFGLKKILTHESDLLVAFPQLILIGSRLYIGWSDNRSGTGWHAYVAFSDNHGTSFSDPVRVNSDFNNGTHVHPSTHIYGGSDGTLYVSWTDDLLGDGTWVRFVSKTLNGIDFTTRARVSQHDGWMGQLTELSDYRLLATWKETIAGEDEILYGVSNNNGETWSEDRLFTYGDVCGWNTQHFDMIVDKDGKMYVALNSRQYEEDNYMFDLFLGILDKPWEGVSKPRGQILPTCVKLNSGDYKVDGDDNRLTAQEPSIAINSKGEVFVVYFANLPSPQTGTGIYLAKVIYNQVPDTNGDNIFGLPTYLFVTIIIIPLLIILILLLLWRRRKGAEED